MERNHQSVKYYPAYDLLVMCQDDQLEVLYKTQMSVDKVSRKYTLYGRVKTFEVLGQAPQGSESYWICVTFDLGEPTCYLWILQISAKDSTVEELIKHELDSDEVCNLVNPAGRLHRGNETRPDSRIFIITRNKVYCLLFPTSNSL